MIINGHDITIEQHGGIDAHVRCHTCGFYQYKVYPRAGWATYPNHHNIGIKRTINGDNVTKAEWLQFQIIRIVSDHVKANVHA